MNESSQHSQTPRPPGKHPGAGGAALAGPTPGRGVGTGRAEWDVVGVQHCLRGRTGRECACVGAMSQLPKCWLAVSVMWSTESSRKQGT